MDALDKKILAEVCAFKHDPKIKNADIMEWSTGEIKPHDGEEIFRLPNLGINISLKIKTK